MFNNPYMIPFFKRVRNVKSLPILEIIDYEINKRMSVDINSLRGLEDPRLFDEFNKWFANKLIAPFNS